MSLRHPRLIGNVVIVVAVFCLVANIVARVAMEEPITSGGSMALVTFTLYALVGGWILRHSPRNPIGFSVATMGSVPLLGNVAEAVADSGGMGLLGELAAWVRVWYFFVFLGAFLPLFHVFPTGRPLPGMWRWWYRSALVAVGSLVLIMMFGPSDEPAYENPFEVSIVTSVRPVLGVVTSLLGVAGLVSAVASLAVRFHRSRGRERDQLKWFFFSVMAAVGVFFLFPALGSLGWIPLGVAEALSVLAFPLPGLGILVAVTRHKLFDIDRIVSRTASYAGVALVIAAVYAVPVLLLPDLLGLSSDLSVALATLAAVAVFTPVRRRLQSIMARRFDRERYDAERVVSAFSGRLQNAVDLGRVTDELGSAVGAALRPRNVSVWFADSVTVPERS